MQNPVGQLIDKFVERAMLSGETIDVTLTDEAATIVKSSQIKIFRALPDSGRNRHQC
jgi:hypothetical protein